MSTSGEPKDEERMNGVELETAMRKPLRAAAPRAAPRAARLVHPRFVVCFLLLAGSAVAIPLTANLAGIYFRKEAVPLKRPLITFDAGALGPTYVLAPQQPKPLADEMLHSLGTEEYYQAALIDTSRPAGDPAKLVSLFVSYYTGAPDMVPHVAEECVVAGGYDLVDQVTRPVTIRGIGTRNETAPVRIARFVSGRTLGAARSELVVSYFFQVNGGYGATRDDVRLSMSNPFLKYAYYMKIEAQFTNERGQSASVEQTLAALPPLLERLLPALTANHLQWNEYTASAGKAHLH